MNNLNDEILELQRHINFLSPIIEKDYNALNENSTFADRFAATINKGTLEHKKRKLQELQRQAHKECNNLCKHNREQCSYCREHYDVSTGEYRAKRKATNKYVYGYLVRDRFGDIRGILNKATEYKELAWIDEDTIEIW